MVNIDFFACTEEQIRTCNWTEAVERFPVAAIGTPDFRGFTALSRLLTGDDRFPALRLDACDKVLYRLDASFITALARCSDDEICDLAVQWADEPVWNHREVNSMDLAGMLFHLQGILPAPDTKHQAVFLWPESE